MSEKRLVRSQERMVAGAVSPPRLDLANEDLVRAHVHAIWLAEIDLSLGKLVRLKAGDILPIDIPETVEANVDGVPLMHCEYGLADGQYALRVNNMLDPYEPDASEFTSS